MQGGLGQSALIPEPTLEILPVHLKAGGSQNLGRRMEQAKPFQLNSEGWKRSQVLRRAEYVSIYLDFDLLLPKGSG